MESNRNLFHEETRNYFYLIGSSQSEEESFRTERSPRCLPIILSLINHPETIFSYTRFYSIPMNEKLCKEKKNS